MSQLLRFVILASAACLLAATPVSKKDNAIAEHNNQFAFDLYKKVILQKDKNVFFSPFSISTALAMTYAGANATTADEMQEALHFEANTSVFHGRYHAYLERLESSAKDNIELNIANRLWGEKNFEFKKDFIEINKSAYASPLSSVNFIEQPKASRNRINKWVEQQTKDRIKDLLAPGMITTDTRLVLTNAIYFKADWLHSFSKSSTRSRAFNLSDQSVKDTDFMHQQRVMGYIETSKYKSVRLPYSGDKQSMIVVLPKQHTDLEKIETSLNQKVIDEVLKARPTLVELALPKFKITEPLGLSSFLKQMGINQAFDVSADFSKMSTEGDLFISDVVHKAFIEIDESGTEAAAATAVVMSLESTSVTPAPIPKQFIADHPFVFFIVDNETEAILFMGRIMDPTKQ